MDAARAVIFPNEAMENCTATNSSCNAGELRGYAFLTFCVLFAIIVIATAALLIFTLTAVCSVQKMARTLRMILASLMIAGLVVAISTLTELLIPIALMLLNVRDPSLSFCRFVLWAYCGGAIARLFNTAAFSVAVLLVVRYRISAVKTARIVVFLVLLWLAAIFLNTYILVPEIFTVQYVDGVACFPRAIIKPARYTITAIWIIFGGIIPVGISIVVPILVLCYMKLKRKRVTQGSDYHKRLAKFALFLFSGSFITFLGQAVVGAIVYSSDAPAVYTTLAIAALSLLPTPLLIVAYLEQVRQRMRAMLTTNWLCCRHCKMTKEHKMLRATSVMAHDVYSAFSGQE